MPSDQGTPPMKPHRDAQALAASLTAAANTPLRLPEREVSAAPETPAPPPQERAGKPPERKPRRLQVVSETVPVTLRPSKELLNRYTNAAADRTKKAGK